MTKEFNEDELAGCGSAWIEWSRKNLGYISDIGQEIFEAGFALANRRLASAPPEGAKDDPQSARVQHEVEFLRALALRAREGWRDPMTAEEIEDTADWLSGIDGAKAERAPETIAELQAAIGRLQAKLHHRVCGDQTVGISSATSHLKGGKS